jgi:glycosyltransferase involved in cell wall biosynthesis
MSWSVVTFSFGGKIFTEYQNFLHNTLSELGLNSFKYCVEDLIETSEYKNNPDYFLLENKYGWCSWKPIFALEAMENLETGDIVMLCDVEDIVHPDIFSYVSGVMGDDPCLLLIGGGQNKNSTKRDCFVYMDCDQEDYWNSPQLEAGISFWKVCDESKRILKEWLKWCLDERVNGDYTNYSGKENFQGFSGWCGKDQSILTNLAIRDGLSVDSGYIRNYLECNADYWYERYYQGTVFANKPIEKYLLEIADESPQSKCNKFKHSIVLTVHNKDWLIAKVIKSIIQNTVGDYELIVVIDGCTDNSESVIKDSLKNVSFPYKIIHTPDVFETKANNAGLKQCSGNYAIIIQDDIVIEEYGWNMRMQKPFIKCDDVFAVSANYSHNFILNENSKHINMEENLDDCWCDILQSVDESSFRNIPRDTFAVRSTVNRGPLMIDLEDLKKLNYLDELYSPQDMDDHDLMFRAYKELGKVCGCYWINFREDPEWGGTRINGKPASWLLKSHHKNSKIFYQRNKNILEERRIIQNRKVS